MKPIGDKSGVRKSETVVNKGDWGFSAFFIEQ
jgi:hypothetical protein